MNKLFVVLLFFLVSCATTTPRIVDVSGNINPKSIALLEKVTIGNVSQWLLIRGADTANPIILFVHGGPGLAEISLAHTPFYSELENSFTVVNWDQRGAGKSFSKKIPKESMTIDQHVADLLEVVRYIKYKLPKNKIFLAGHGWGSIPAIIAAQQHPELFHAYIGICQFVNAEKGEKIAYNFAVKAAKTNDDDAALIELRRIGSPPYKNPLSVYSLTRFTILFGGMLYSESDWWPVTKASNKAKEYNFFDKNSKYNNGLNFCMLNLQAEINNTKLDDSITELTIPTYFIEGKNDKNTPTELAEEYFNLLKAPKKEYFLMERSAHMPLFEEPANALEVFEKIRKETIE